MFVTGPTLVEVDDSDFAWLLHKEPQPRSGLRPPPGGVDEPVIVEHVRGIVARLRAAGCSAGWMIVAADEVVGLCSYKRPPSPQGEVEIGYGIAASRRNRGYATRAVAAMLAHARRDPAVRVVVAGTVPDNAASQRVLERNGFKRVGECPDPDDGSMVILWEYPVK